MKNINLKKSNDAENKTKGRRKLYNYIREVFDTDSFQDFIKDVRLEYDIPKKGFRVGKSQMHIPPKEWKLSKERDYRRIRMLYMDKIKPASEKYHLNYHIEGGDIIAHYLFYNSHSKVFGNFCTVVDVIERGKENIPKELEMKLLDSSFPVSVRISPYASLNDILDYVTKMYSYRIFPIQNKYKNKNIKIASFKRKDPRIITRNKFILKHADLPSKEIVKLIMKKFGPESAIDCAYISKIISLKKGTGKKL